MSVPLKSQYDEVCLCDGVCSVHMQVSSGATVVAVVIVDEEL
jgi:hypothetical protein